MPSNAHAHSRATESFRGERPLGDAGRTAEGAPGSKMNGLLLELGPRLFIQINEAWKTLLSLF